MSYSNNYYSGGGGGGSSNNNRGGGNNNNNNNGANYRSGGGGYSSSGGSGGGGGYTSGGGGGGYNNQPSSGYNNNNNRGGGGGGGGGYSSRAPQQQQSYNNSRPQYGNNNQGGGGGGGGYNQGSGGYNNNNNNRSAQQYGGGGNGGGYNSNSGGHRSDMRPQYAPSVPGGGASAYASRTNNNNTYGGGGGGGYNSGGGMGMGQRSTSSNNGPSGLEKVNCSKHNKQRLRKFCTEQAVYNADGEVLRMAFSCRDEDPCTTKDSFRTDSDIAAGDDNGEEATMLFGVKITSSSTKKDDAAAQTPVIDVDAIDSSTSSSAALMKIKPIITPTTPRTATSAYEGLPDSAANGRNASRSMLGGSSALGLFGGSGSGSPTIVSPTSTTTTAGGPQFRNGPVTSNRYYDLGGSNATEDRVENKKVCWQCGMSTHEKPNCKNTLCFTCHTHQEPGYNGKMNHQCVPVPPSSFVALDPALTGTFLSNAEVIAHNKHNDESFNDYRKEVERLQHESDDVVRERLQAVKVSSRSGDNAAVVTPDDIMEDPSLKQLFMEPTEEERVLMSFGYLYHIPTKGDNTASLYHKAVVGGADEETPAAVCSGLLSTQCLRCHRFGHMDCPIEPEWKTPTTSRSKETMNCCYCLGVGHTGLSCTTRRRDIWRERAVQASIDQVGRTNVFTSPDDGQALGLVAPSRYPQQGSPTGGIAITSAYAASMQQQQQRSTTTTTGVYNRRETFSVSDDEEDAFSSKLSKNRMGGQQPPQSSSSRRGRSYSSSSSYSRSPSSSSDSEDEYDPSKRSQKKMHSTTQFHQKPRGIPNRAGRASPPSRPQQHNNNNTYNNHSSSGGGGGGGHFNKRSRSGDFDNRPQHQSGGRRQEGPPQPPRGGMNRGGSNNNNNNRRAGGNFEF